MKYPVICLKPGDTMIYGFKDEKSLKTADKKLTENGVFDNVTIVDAEGGVYLIKETSIVGWATPFWGYSWKKSGRLVRIDFKLEPRGVFSLEELKKEVLQRMRKNSYFQETFTVEEMEGHVAASNTVSRLLSFFG